MSGGFFTESDGAHSLSFGDRRLVIQNSDILALTADALVCPVDPSLDIRTGLAKIVTDAAGSSTRDQRPTMQEPFGKVIVLPGGKLKAKYIFLSVLLGERGPEKIRASIRQAVERSIHYAEFLRLKSLGFPLLGSPVAAPPFQFVAKEMLEQVTQYLTRRRTRIKLVFFSIRNAEAYDAFRRESRSFAGS